MILRSCELRVTGSAAPSGLSALGNDEDIDQLAGSAVPLLPPPESMEKVCREINVMIKKTLEYEMKMSVLLPLTCTM